MAPLLGPWITQQSTLMLKITLLIIHSPFCLFLAAEGFFLPAD
jgi:hypothetical protein